MDDRDHPFPPYPLTNRSRILKRSRGPSHLSLGTGPPLPSPAARQTGLKSQNAPPGPREFLNGRATVRPPSGGDQLATRRVTNWLQKSVRPSPPGTLTNWSTAPYLTLPSAVTSPVHRPPYPTGGDQLVHWLPSPAGRPTNLKTTGPTPPAPFYGRWSTGPKISGPSTGPPLPTRPTAGDQLVLK